jgi:hypothetical protein
MHKSRVVFGCMALVLTLALLIPLVGCGGGGTSNTATPTGTTTGATTTPTKTPTATKTPTSTSSSGKTLADIYGVGKSIGDVKYDQIVTVSGETQSTTKVYMKDAWLEDKMKFRYEMTQEGMTVVILMDLATKIGYNYLPDQNMAYKIDMSDAELSDPTENSDQIIPVKVGTETIDGKSCDVYQWTYQGTSSKEWIWKDKSLPIKTETTSSYGTTTTECKNIVFGTLSNSLFELPSGVEIVQLPGSP